MSEHKIIIESASLDDIKALIETRDKWGDSGAPVWITLSEDNPRTGAVRWSLRSSQDWRHSALGRIEAKRATTGGISLTFQVPALFPDPGMLCYLVSETTEEIEKRGYVVQQIAPLLSHPPSPTVKGWDAVFEWYYRWQRETGQRMTVTDLADKIGYKSGYVRQCKSLYDAEHGKGENNE